MTRELSQYCEISLGFKSLLNDFYYVGEETKGRFKIEDEFLVPIFMLADLDEKSIVQRGDPCRWVFTCRKSEPDLRGTGAWAYIDWGARQVLSGRKQSKDPATYRATLEKQGGREWWWPKAALKPTNLAVRKGINERYAPFLFETAQIVDQRLYTIRPRGELDQSVVLAFLASSLFPLSLETNADLGLGAGVLTLSTGGLRSLPTIDLLELQRSSGWPAVQDALDVVLASRPPGAFELGEDESVAQLDAAVLDALGLDRQRWGEASAAVATLADARLGRSRKRQLVRAAASAADLERTSEPVANELRAWLASRVFPEDFIQDGVGVRQYVLPPGVLRLKWSYFMGNVDLEVVDASDSVVLTEQLPGPLADLVIRCLQLGRRSFLLPVDAAAGLALEQDLHRLLSSFDGVLRSAIERTSLGSRYEAALHDLVLRKLHIDVGGLRTPLDPEGKGVIVVSL